MDMTLVICVVAAIGSLILLMAVMWRSSPEATVDTRVERVAQRTNRGTRPVSTSNPSALARIGSVFEPKDEEKLTGLTTRLRQAGLYKPHLTSVYLGSRVVLLIAPVAVGLGLSSIGMMTSRQGILLGFLVGVLGNMIPVLWLGHLKRRRQKNIRRAVPDALDVIVICLEGGVSLNGSFQRVAEELKQAHPLLSSEMAIVLREIQLGRSTGEAMRNFADRFDAEELRSLAAVIIQAERFGASIVEALRVHADDLRLRRHQYAEAEAQKAPVKLVFPTVLFIFPALYIVLMGPAGVQLMEMFRKLDR
jgi:tight adherence protein C